MPVEKFINEGIDVLPDGRKVKWMTVDVFDPSEMRNKLNDSSLPSWERWVIAARLLNTGCVTEEEVNPILMELAKSLNGKVLLPPEYD